MSIKKYPDDFMNKIICGDCLEVMKEMPGECIDLIITDPPYGTTFKSSNFRKQMKKYDLLTEKSKFKRIIGDENINTKVIKDLYRVMKNNGALYLYTRWDVYHVWKKEIEEYFSIKNLIIWYKKGGGIGDLSGAYIYNHEFCIFATKGKHILRGKRTSDVWELKKDSASSHFHPTQKPVSAMLLPITKSSDESNVIFDPFLGSGTTAEACKLLKRDFIGIEINPEYCKIAEERLAQGVL